MSISHCRPNSPRQLVSRRIRLIGSRVVRLVGLQLFGRRLFIVLRKMAGGLDFGLIWLLELGKTLVLVRKLILFCLYTFYVLTDTL